MTGCLTLLPVLIAALLDEKVMDQARVGCWVAVGAIAVALLYDGEKLVSAVRVANARRRDPAVGAMATSVSYEPELRAKLLAEINRQVEQRLESAYGEQTPINIQMQPDQNAVEGRKRESNVFLMPKQKQYVENFKDNRVRLAQSEETIIDTFDDKAILGQLLILGAPGSGKTTALLKLTKDLLARAEATGIEIPYIFELSAWRDGRQDIASWLVAQLAFEHGIKETVSREWILNGQLLPLLDGLDELATDRRQTCIKKINEFVTSRLGRRVVVCCRTKVYEASGQKLTALGGALQIQPLEISQVRDYFERVNPKIWEALQDEAGLGELLKPNESEEEPTLLQIPLFLQILAIAYQPGKTVSSKSALLDAYITHRLSLKVRKSDRRLARKKEIAITWAYKTVQTEPAIEITQQYLGWLARSLNEKSIPNVFLIEQMQPSWLETNAQKWQYRLIYGLIVGLIYGLKEDFQTRETPNQGIIASAKNVLFVTGVSYPAAVLLYFLPRYVIQEDVVLQDYLLSGLFASLFIGFYFGGGVAVLQHCILRFLLHRQGHIPRNYAQFLKYTTERRLTQQIGGRFRFIHRELLDHFAAMKPDSSKVG